MPVLRVDGYPAVSCDVGTTLLDACEAAGIPMRSDCGGFAACNACRVTVLEGELSPLLEEEKGFLDEVDQRLGCQARLLGDAAVRLAPGS